MDLISIPLILLDDFEVLFLDLYILPCFWVDKFIYVLFHSFYCIYARVTLMALFPHPFGSTSKGFALISSFIQILGHLIALPINVSWSSITIANDICTLQIVPLSWVFLIWYTILFLEYEIVMQIVILLHSIAWLRDLFMYVKFGSLLNFYLSTILLWNVFLP